MEAFGIIGMTMGIMGFILAQNATEQVKVLEKRLEDAGVLPDTESIESPARNG